jgi:hypothetical protein
MAVYLLHFDRPYRAKTGRGAKEVQHYLGYTNGESVDARVQRHRSKTQGAKLTQVIAREGIGFVVARVWAEGDRELEKRLKSRRNHKRLCPVCKEAG